ncbi:MAG: T9SS type A sorting domain-containing protein, partial [Cyclobacteriaceae bacterium]
DVYPNPSAEYLNLAGINDEVSDTQLVDLAGRQYSVDFERHPQFYQVKLNHLSQGIYLLQFKAGGVLHRIKVVKNNN